MRHIEDGECLEISQERLLFEQSKKLMQKEALESSVAASVPSLVDIDDEAGGVELPSKTLSERNREAMANQPGRATSSTATRSLIDDHWPQLPPGETGLEHALGDLMDFSTPEPKGKEKEKENDNASYSGKTRERSSSSQAGSAAAPSIGDASIGPPDTEFILRKVFGKWDARKFIDELTGEYVCACGKRCNTKVGFEKHVLAKSQGSRRMQYVVLPCV